MKVVLPRLPTHAGRSAGVRAQALPNTYKASLVKRTQFDNTGWGANLLDRLENAP